MSSKIKILWHVHTYLGRVIIFLPGLQFMGTNRASAQNASFKAGTSRSTCNAIGHFQRGLLRRMLTTPLMSW